MVREVAFRRRRPALSQREVYSACPRLSQFPSIRMRRPGFAFRMGSLASSVARPWSVRSDLSKSK